MVDVTIAFVFRERVSPTVPTLKSLIEITDYPHNLIVFDNASPALIAKELKELAEVHGFDLLRSEKILSPNQQRNACFAKVKTPYVVFIDNDIVPEAGWLEGLINCAKETGAGLVAPLYFEELNEVTRFHMYDGHVSLVDKDGNPTFDEVLYNTKRDIDALRPSLKRTELGIVEFHAVLVDSAMLRSFNGLDNGLMSMREHADLSIQTLEAGRTIYSEPSVVVKYEMPTALDPMDVAFFRLRWSEAWSKATKERLMEKYGVPANSRELQGAVKFPRFHRQRASIRIPFLRKLLPYPIYHFIYRVIGQFEKRFNRIEYPAYKHANWRDFDADAFGAPSK